jgi:hypothetical protein
MKLRGDMPCPYLRTSSTFKNTTQNLLINLNLYTCTEGQQTVGDLPLCRFPRAGICRHLFPLSFLDDCSLGETKLEKKKKKKKKKKKIIYTGLLSL